MRRLMLLIISLAYIVLPLAMLQPSPVYAVDVLNNCTTGNTSTACVNVCAQAPESTLCKNQQSGDENALFGKSGVITTATRFLVYLTTIASVIVLILAGFQYITAGGDSNSVSKAKDAIIYALVGLAIALVAQMVVTFVLTRI